MVSSMTAGRKSMLAVSGWDWITNSAHTAENRTMPLTKKKQNCFAQGAARAGESWKRQMLQLDDLVKDLKKRKAAGGAAAAVPASAEGGPELLAGAAAAEPVAAAAQPAAARLAAVQPMACDDACSEDEHDLNTDSGCADYMLAMFRKSRCASLRPLVEFFLHRTVRPAVSKTHPLRVEFTKKVICSKLLCSRAAREAWVSSTESNRKLRFTTMPWRV